MFFLVSLKFLEANWGKTFFEGGGRMGKMSPMPPLNIRLNVVVIVTLDRTNVSNGFQSNKIILKLGNSDHVQDRS